VRRVLTFKLVAKFEMSLLHCNSPDGAVIVLSSDIVYQ